MAAVLGFVSVELGVSQEGLWGCPLVSPQSSLRGLLSALCPLPQALSSWFLDLSGAWKDTELRPRGSVDPFQGRGLGSLRECGWGSFPGVWAELSSRAVGWTPSRGCGRGSQPEVWAGLQEFGRVLGANGAGEVLED